MESLSRKQLRIEAVVPEITQPLEHRSMEEILLALQLWAVRNHCCPCCPASPSGEGPKPSSHRGQRTAAGRGAEHIADISGVGEMGTNTATSRAHQIAVLLLERRKPTGNWGERPKNITVLIRRKLLEKEKSGSARNVPSGLCELRAAVQKSLTWQNFLSLLNSNNTGPLCPLSRADLSMRKSSCIRK